MSTILGLDLGKVKSVACANDTETTSARLATAPTERSGLVVFETCTVAGWVADMCQELSLPFAVADPMHEAWNWSETDRNDVLKPPRQAALKGMDFKRGFGGAA